MMNIFGKAKIIKNQGEALVEQDRKIKQQNKRIEEQKEVIADLMKDMCIDNKIIEQQKEKIKDLENNIEFLVNNSRNTKIKELRG